MERGAEAGGEREWWLRTLAIFQDPVSVFSALDDDSDEADARQEPVLTLVVLAAIAAVLTTPTTGELLDSPDRDALLVAVLVFLTGALYGLATYWIGGGAVYLGIRGAGGPGSYRLARHLLAFAAAPLALSLLVVWPIELAIYGRDLFRTGGGDARAAHRVFDVLEAVFFLWSFALLVIGIRAVHGWTTVRSLGALGLALFALIGFALVPFLL